jgi:hypothetical protein
MTEESIIDVEHEEIKDDKHPRRRHFRSRS